MNAGKYNKKIDILKITPVLDSAGFKISEKETTILSAYANVKTTKGYTLIQNDSDFEKAYTNFTIRYPNIAITRDMIILFNSKRYTIEYLNNVDNSNIELEIQAKEITK